MSALSVLDGPPQPAMPKVLLHGPVNATWAANNAAPLVARGFHGLVFCGVYDTLDAAPQSKLTDTDPEAPESALLKELRLAQARLAEAGLDENYLKLHIGPDDLWFINRDRVREGIACFRSAGIVAARAGLSGIIIDTQPAAALYDYRWQSYGDAEVSSTRIAQGARDFGARAMRAFLREFPDAHIILAGTDQDAPGALWYDLVDGLISGIGAASSIHLDILLAMPPMLADYAEMKHHLEAQEARFKRGLSAESQEIWRLQGGISAELTPVAMHDDKARLDMSQEAFRVQLAAAKTLSASHVFIHAAPGTWWRATERDARTYSASRLKGLAAIQPAPALAKDLARWTMKTPLDHMTRVGEHPEGAYIYQYGKKDARQFAGVFWKGLKSPLVLGDRQRATRIVHLADAREELPKPQDGTITLPPSDAALLVEELPARAWAVPASLWFTIDGVLEAGSSRTQARFGYVNVLPGTLEGQIEISSTRGLSLGATSFPLLLAPQQSATFQRGIQGALAPGSEVDATISLLLPGGEVSRSHFHTTVRPRLLWEWRRDAGFRAPPLVIPGGSDGPLVIAASSGGDIAGYTAEGTLRWQRRFKATFESSPTPGRDGEEQIIALADTGGNIRVLGVDGAARWEAKLPSPARADGLLFADLHQTGRDVLLVVSDDGAVRTFEPGGAPGWTHQGPAGKTWLASAAAHRDNAPDPAAEGLLFLTHTGEDAALIRLNPFGKPMWRRTLQADVAGAPTILAARLGQPRVAVPCTDRTIALFTADIGESLPHLAPKSIGNIAHMLHVAWPRKGPQSLLIGEVGLAMLDETLAAQWSRPFAPHTIAIDRPGERLLLQTGTNKLHLLDAAGTELWKSTQGMPSLHVARQVLPAMGRQPVAWVAGSADGYLQCFALTY